MIVHVLASRFQALSRLMPPFQACLLQGFTLWTLVYCPSSLEYLTVHWPRLSWFSVDSASRLIGTVMTVGRP